MYCDFNTYAGKRELIPAYLKALNHEATCHKKWNKGLGKFHTIYFGGGTPSIIPAILLEETISNVLNVFDWSDHVEITLEVNPGMFAFKDLDAFQQSGINRISIGAQTFNNNELKILGRNHSPEDTLEVLNGIRIAGFTNVNVDLIYGIPQQTVESWMKTLKAALDLKPEHLSLYALTLDESVPMTRMIKSGTLEKINEDKSAEMYIQAREMLKDQGYLHYEISNWAKIDPKQDYRCQHNLQYWRGLPFLGLGAGAHSYINHRRWENETLPERYIAKWLDSSCRDGIPAISDEFSITNLRELSETLVMGLRLVDEGISVQGIQKRFKLALMEKYYREISELKNNDLIEIINCDSGDEIIRLSPKGHLLASIVMREFIDLS